MTDTWGLFTSATDDAPPGGHHVAVLVGGTAASIGWVRGWADVPALLVAAGTQLGHDPVALAHGQADTPVVDLPDHLAEELSHTDLRGR